MDGKDQMIEYLKSQITYLQKENEKLLDIIEKMVDTENKRTKPNGNTNGKKCV